MKPDLLNGAFNLAQFVLPALVFAWADRKRPPTQRRT